MTDRVNDLIDEQIDGMELIIERVKTEQYSFIQIKPVGRLETCYIAQHPSNGDRWEAASPMLARRVGFDTIPEAYNWCEGQLREAVLAALEKGYNPRQIAEGTERFRRAEAAMDEFVLAHSEGK